MELGRKRKWVAEDAGWFVCKIVSNKDAAVEWVISWGQQGDLSACGTNTDCFIMFSFDWRDSWGQELWKSPVNSFLLGRILTSASKINKKVENERLRGQSRENSYTHTHTHTHTHTQLGLANPNMEEAGESTEKNRCIAVSFCHLVVVVQ